MGFVLFVFEQHIPRFLRTTCIEQKLKHKQNIMCKISRFLDPKKKKNNTKNQTERSERKISRAYLIGEADTETEQHTA